MGREESALIGAMRRGTVIHGDYADVLPALEKDLWDVVYFDPMFDKTLTDSAGLDLVRLLAVYGQPDRDVIHEAQRVARRSVVVKNQAPGRLLRSLGFPIVSDSGKIWYGRLDESQQ